jgi:hypothetical protein
MADGVPACVGGGLKSLARKRWLTRMASAMTNLLSRVRAPLAVCALLAPLTSGSASAQNVLPNLEPFPASEVRLTDGGNTLRFTTTSWNRGAGPMELVGGEIIEDGDPENPGKRRVYQRIFKADGTSTLAEVGIFEYHGGTHNHFHLENFARYTLQPVNAPGGSQRSSAKVSFCLIDNTKVNTRLPNAPKKPRYELCSFDIQGISVGWGDTYGYALDGQSFDFTGNPSGDYLLKVEVNPLGNLFESNTADNISCALLRIDRSLLSVQTLDTACNPTSGAVTIESITPVSLRLGSQATVTILGSGFSSGIDVHFSGGSGKAPVVSNIQVISGATMTATVTVASGGSQADPVWDLNVGSAVLPNAFTVLR